MKELRQLNAPYDPELPPTYQKKKNPSYRNIESFDKI